MTAAARGTICIVELNTPDMEHAGGYYADIFDWTTVEALEVSTYGFFQQQGKTVAALRHIADGDSFWLPYVLVDDAAQMVAQASHLGARLHADVTEVQGVARTAVVEDPAGGVIGFWEPRGHRGAELTAVHGSLWWTELVTPEIDAARDFYAKLLGWRTVESKMRDVPYAAFEHDARSMAGLLRAPAPPDEQRWRPIFSVSDCRAVVDRAEELGGAIDEPVKNITRVGALGVMKDPGGATFCVVQLVQPFGLELD